MFCRFKYVLCRCVIFVYFVSSSNNYLSYVCQGVVLDICIKMNNFLCSVYLVQQERGRRPEQQPWMPWWAMFTVGQPKPNWRDRAQCLLATGSGSSDYRSLITTCAMPNRCGWPINGQLLWPDQVCIYFNLLYENRESQNCCKFFS